jgi:hypothetical protein
MSEKAKALKEMMAIIGTKSEKELRAFCSGLQLSGLLKEQKDKTDKKPA